MCAFFSRPCSSRRLSRARGFGTATFQIARERLCERRRARVDRLRALSRPGSRPRAGPSRCTSPRNCARCAQDRQHQRDAFWRACWGSRSRRENEEEDAQLVPLAAREVDGGLCAHACLAVEDHRLLLGWLVEAVHARKVACERELGTESAILPTSHTTSNAGQARRPAALQGDVQRREGTHPRPWRGSSRTTTAGG